MKFSFNSNEFYYLLLHIYLSVTDLFTRIYQKDIIAFGFNQYHWLPMGHILIMFTLVSSINNQHFERLEYFFCIYWLHCHWEPLSHFSIDYLQKNIESWTWVPAALIFYCKWMKHLTLIHQLMNMTYHLIIHTKKMNHFSPFETESQLTISQR